MEVLKILLGFTLAGTFLLACPLDEPKRDAKIPVVPTAEHQSSSDGIIFIQVEKQNDKKKLAITLRNVPEKADLRCAIEKKRLDTCAPSFDMPFPSKDGVYTLTVVAEREHAVVAVGEKKFVIGEASELDEQLKNFQDSLKYQNDLGLELEPELKINGEKFFNGMAIPVSKETTFKFRFKHPPACDPVVRCRSDSLKSEFKPLCDRASEKVYVPGTMARGLQFLQVEASCGDKAGEPLLIYWYGVPEGYEFMALAPTAIDNTAKQQKRYYFNLMKDNDCPENELSFECKSAAGEAFKKCENSVDNPTTGFEIRPICKGKTYKALALK